jgi:hypothetical protein
MEAAKELLEMVRLEFTAIGNAVKGIPLLHKLDCLNLMIEVVGVKGSSLHWLGFVEMEVMGEKRFSIRLTIAGG